MKIAGRIFLSFSLLTVLATVMVGLAITYGSSRFITSATDARITHTLDLLEHEFKFLYNHLGQDTEFLGKTLAELGSAGLPLDAFNTQVEQLFRVFLRSRPDYFKVTLVSPDGSGSELVRVGRVGGRIVVTPKRQLRTSRQDDVIERALTDLAQDIAFSRIQLNRENGELEQPLRPALDAAKTIITETRDAIGVIVISVGMNNVFTRMQDFADTDAALLLACGQNGEIIMHPNSALTFGANCGGEGETYLIQEQIPAAAALLNGQADEIRPGPQALRRLDASLGRLRRLNLQATPNGGLILGVLVSRKTLQANIAQIHRQSAVLILVFACVGFVLALVLERRVSGPLRELTNAVRRIARGDPNQGLPAHRHDEIGTLARRIDSLVKKLNAKIKALDEQELRLKGLIQSCNDAIIEVDETGVIEEYNRAAQALFGYSAEEVMGHNWSMLIVTGDADHTDLNPSRYVAFGENRVIDRGQRVQGQHKDGRMLDLSLAVHSFEFHEQLKFTATLHLLDEIGEPAIPTPS